MIEKTRASDGQSISRAVCVLRAIAEHPGSSLSELSRATGLARSTVQRLVGALSVEGLATRNTGHKGVFLGMELARLGAQVKLDARRILLPLMDELHARIDGNLDLTMIQDGKVTVIEQRASSGRLREVSYVGRQHPIHASANGKAHLGQLTRSAAEALLSADLTPYTARTITNRARLLDQVDIYRQLGLYLDHEEFLTGACAMATALPAIGERHLTLAIAMETQQFEARKDDIKVALLEFSRTVCDRFCSSV